MMLAIFVTFSLLTVINCNDNITTIGPTTHAAPTTTSALVTTSSAYVSTTTHANHSSKYWVVYYDGTNRFCLIMDAVIVIELVTKSEHTQWIEIGRDTNATVSGKCGKDENNITLWQENFQFSLTFSKNKDNTFNISYIELKYNESMVISSPLTLLYNMGSSKSYYTCNKNQTLFSGKNDTITVKQLKLEVFQNETMEPPDFYPQAVSCETTDNLIPIIVGAALGGLIIIVLVAYLIGRHRSRRGYESV